MPSWMLKGDTSKICYYGILLWGGLLSLLGGIGTISFLRDIQQGHRIPPGQIAARLILPHITLLTGLGMILAGMILLRKRAILQERQQDKKSDQTAA